VLEVEVARTFGQVVRVQGPDHLGVEVRRVGWRTLPGCSLGLADEDRTLLQVIARGLSNVDEVDLRLAC